MCGSLADPGSRINWDGRCALRSGVLCDAAQATTEGAGVTAGLAGRAIAGVGIVCGLLGVALTIVTLPDGFSPRHVADGTAFGFLVIALALASHFPAEIGSDLRGAAFGAAGLGFFLFVPARFAFDDLDFVDAGGWLGVCSILIPIGYLVLRLDRPHAPAARPARTPATLLADRGTLLALAGLALLVVGVWFGIDDGGPSWWDLSKTLAILLLLLAVTNAYFLWRGPADVGLLVAGTTFGLAVYPWVYHAFEELGSLGAGGWLEALGGLALLVGVADAWRTAAVPVAHEPPAPAAAAP
jgi:hypothetical protein